MDNATTATVELTPAMALWTAGFALLTVVIITSVAIKVMFALDRRRRLRQPNAAKDWDGEKVDAEFKGVMQDLLR